MIKIESVDGVLAIDIDQITIIAIDERTPHVLYIYLKHAEEPLEFTFSAADNAAHVFNQLLNARENRCLNNG